MSTNRTKIDWAYYQAARIKAIVLEADSYGHDSYAVVRKIAAILRRVEQRGIRRGAI